MAEIAEGPVAVASLRMHPFPVTTLMFAPDGLSLVSGDEGGWVFWWSMLSRRPEAIFRPHEKSIVSLKWVGGGDGNGTSVDKLLTHGRDNKLYIWQLPDQPGILKNQLPNRNSDSNEWSKPWMIHSQDVNTLNFCGASVFGQFIAVPNTVNSSRIDVYALKESQLSRPINGLNVTSMDDQKLGILMALQLTADRVIAAYESGHIVVFDTGTQELLFCSQLHSQPVLSLGLCDSDTGNGGITIVSTSADSLIVKLDLDTLQYSQYNTKHKGMAHVDVRSDGRIIATAGWDGMVRLFKLSNFKPLASFAGGRQDGVTAVSFSRCQDDGHQEDRIGDDKKAKTVVERKKQAIRSSHMLAVAGKDGRIALYNVY